MNDATPAAAAVLEALLDPLEAAAQRARPRFQPGYTLAALEAGRLVGAALLAHERRRIGAAVLDIAVAALPAAHAARQALFEPVVVAAATAGLAWLYVPTAPLDELPGMAVGSLQSRLIAPDLPLTGMVLRPATPDDATDLTALGAALAEQTPLSPERTAADWRWMIMYGGAEVLVLEDERGRGVGYAVCGADGVVGEAYAADAGVSRALLAALAARRLTTLQLGPAHPVARTALVHGGQLQLTTPDRVAPLWGVIDLAAALRELAPELSMRLQRSRYAGWSGRIHLETESTQAALTVIDSRVTVQAPPEQAPDIAIKRIALAALPQLLLGYRAVADLRASGALQCAESDLGLLDLLFPQLPAS